MKFLKGLALSILGLLLFLSLSTFGLLFALHITVLSPDFAVKEVDKLDLVGTARDLVNQQLGSELSQLPSWVAQPINDTLGNAGPWLKQQVDSSVHAGYAYFLGKTTDLNISIDLAPLKDDLRNRLWDSISKSPPPEFSSIPPAMRQQYFNQYFDQFAAQIPSTYAFGLQSLSPDVRAQVEQVRQAIGYMEMLYYGLIAFMLLLVAGIVLIHRQVRGAARSLGSIFLSYGIVEYVGVIVGKNLGLPQLSGLPVPAQLQIWIPRVLADVVWPLEMFSLGVGIAGVALLVVSFVYTRREAAE